jgi:hypothetical protein
LLQPLLLLLLAWCLILLSFLSLLHNWHERLYQPVQCRSSTLNLQSMCIINVVQSLRLPSRAVKSRPAATHEFMS